MISRGFYRHFKGGLYFLERVAMNSENPAQHLIIYTDQMGICWARPSAMWNEEVRWPDGSWKPRFVKETG